MGGNAMTRLLHVGLLAALIAVVGPAPSDAQTGTSLGSVTLKRGVKANGQPLAAGTYTVRLTAEDAQAAVGQSAGAERWVEFVRGGKVVGREIASVVSDADIAQIANGPGKPAKGGTRVDTLKGDEFVRVWINRGGNNYLIHLPV
jgi:hypothetical protein